MVSTSHTLGANHFEPFNLPAVDPLFPVPSGESGFTGRWDVDRPNFSYSRISSAYDSEAEIIPVSLDGGFTVARFEFFIQDNALENNNNDEGAGAPGNIAEITDEWNPNDSSSGDKHPDVRPSNPPAGDGRPRGIRDSTLWQEGQTTYREAFGIKIAGSGLERTDFNDEFFTSVEHNIFAPPPTPLPHGIRNDSYFSLRLKTPNPWTPEDSFLLVYNQDKAFITDLAGNLLPSTTTKPLPAIDQVPPKILLALAPAGDDKIYLQFSEPVYHDYLISRGEVTAGDFVLKQGGLPVSGLSILRVKFLDWGISSASGSAKRGAEKLVLHLNRLLSVEEALNMTVESAWDNTPAKLKHTIQDYRGNEWRDNTIPTGSQGPAPRPITDVGIGVAGPVWASDGYDFNSQQSVDQAATTVKNFDGTSRLRSSDIMLQARVDESLFSTSPPVATPSTPFTLYYDVDPPGSFRGSDNVFSKMWLPMNIGEIINANTEARSTLAYSVSTDGYLRNFMIPKADPENTAGGLMEFLFMMEAPDPVIPSATRMLPVARYMKFNDYNPNDEYAGNPTPVVPLLQPPFEVLPWSFQIAAPIVQRGGVSIYNNVINPNRGDKALLTYTLRKGGMVTVNVFSLDGSLVYAMHRGNQAAGVYEYYWDGRNMGGRPVARGIYFVRVVGPGIDEIRKVMVVK
jgi:hypothetical protein